MSIRTLLSTLSLTSCLVGALSSASYAETIELSSFTTDPTRSSSKTVKEWMAQMQASDPKQPQTEIVLITNIRLDRTDAGLQVILETPEGTTLQSSTREVDNSLIIEIPNAVLSLSLGKEFRTEKPLDGIASIVVTQLETNRVQIMIAGIEAVPLAQVIPSQTGLQLSLTPNNDAPEEEITVIGAGDRQNPLPQTGIAREEFSRRNNLQLGDILQRLPGVVGGWSSRSEPGSAPAWVGQGIYPSSG